MWIAEFLIIEFPHITAIAKHILPFGEECISLSDVICNEIFPDAQARTNRDMLKMYQH